MQKNKFTQELLSRCKMLAQLLLSKVFQHESVFNDTPHPLLVETPYNSSAQFNPFVVVNREHGTFGRFYRQGTLDAIIAKHTDGTPLPQKIVALQSSPEPSTAIVKLTLDDQIFLKKKYGMELQNTKIIDFTNTTDELVDYLTKHVKFTGAMKEVLGKRGYFIVVMAALYASSVSIPRTSSINLGILRSTKQESLLFSAKDDRYPLMVAFTALRFKINPDGTLSNPKWVTK